MDPPSCLAGALFFSARLQGALSHGVKPRLGRAALPLEGGRAASEVACGLAGPWEGALRRTCTSEVVRRKHSQQCDHVVSGSRKPGLRKCVGWGSQPESSVLSAGNLPHAVPWSPGQWNLKALPILRGARGRGRPHAGEGLGWSLAHAGFTDPVHLLPLLPPVRVIPTDALWEPDSGAPRLWQEKGADSRA